MRGNAAFGKKAARVALARRQLSFATSPVGSLPLQCSLGEHASN